ncbi:hypothetical protein JXD38_00135 [candidate division WOR-3 bacterium]|nr:hypothetical protein [candidate division WOR-3 bacterium]
MSTADTTIVSANESGSAREVRNSPVSLRALWHRYARKAVAPSLFVLAVGLGLLLAKAATYSQSHAAGFERGRATALRELGMYMAKNDSIRHEGELQAVRVLRNVRFFFLGRHSRGWCFVKYANSSEPNWSIGWVKDVKYIEPGRAYNLNPRGYVWDRPLR